MRRAIACVVLALGSLAPPATGQVTRTPTFQSPYRSFTNVEYGGTVSFPGASDLALEGFYALAAGRLDIEFQSGLLLPEGPGDAIFLIGAGAKHRVVTHSPDFPMDGSLIFGVGGNFGEGSDIVAFPIGLSVGRRLNVEDSEVSIVPFVSPMGWLVVGDDERFDIAVGAGAEFELTRRFDLRISAALGDVDGIALSVAWKQ